MDLQESQETEIKSSQIVPDEYNKEFEQDSANTGETKSEVTQSTTETEKYFYVDLLSGGLIYFDKGTLFRLSIATVSFGYFPVYWKVIDALIGKEKEVKKEDEFDNYGILRTTIGSFLTMSKPLSYFFLPYIEISIGGGKIGENYEDSFSMPFSFGIHLFGISFLHATLAVSYDPFYIGKSFDWGIVLGRVM